MGTVSYTHLDVYKRQAIGGSSGSISSGLDDVADSASGAAKKMKPVSYTHLDVYKRQL